MAGEDLSADPPKLLRFDLAARFCRCGLRLVPALRWNGRAYSLRFVYATAETGLHDSAHCPICRAWWPELWQSGGFSATPLPGAQAGMRRRGEGLP